MQNTSYTNTYCLHFSETLKMLNQTYTTKMKSYVKCFFETVIL